MDSKQKQFLYKVTLRTYVVGLPYCWFEECKLSPFIQKIIKKSCILLNIVTCGFFTITGVSPLFTQKNLKEQQIFDILMYNVLSFFFYVLTFCLRYYKDDVKNLMYELAVRSPAVYNDPKVEAEMIKKATFLSRIIILMGGFGTCMIIIDSSLRSLRNDEAFTTIITAWPDLEDKSAGAGAFRILVCIVWCVLIAQCVTSVNLLICIMIYIEHQFRQLYSYFCSLANIFEEDLNQQEKEEKYEAALKIGFRQHCDILGYTRRLEKTCHVGYSAQIIMNVLLLAMIMIRLANEEKTLTTVISGALFAITILNTTGLYMATLGDITLENDKLTTAMYMSGWENYTRSSSVRVRRLLSIGMSQTQNPFEIYALGVISMSLSSYVTIVKYSYSIFSVIV